MALGYQNPFYLKQAQRKQHSLYNGKVLLEKHDPPVVYDSEETLQLAQESRLKMIQLNKEIKPKNYAKIDHHSRVFVSQTAKSREEKYFSNTSKTANFSKSISIPNEEFLDVTTPSVARKFLNEVKSTIVTLQRVVKQKMTLDIHNWSSSVHQEIHKIIKDEIFPIVNHVDARVQNFKIHFLKEAAKFVRDFKSLANEADESLAKHKALEFEIDRLLRAIVSQDIMSIVQNPNVVETSDLQTELEHTKERFENCIFKKENEYAKLWNEWYKNAKMSKERLASPKPRKPRTCLRWSPTGSMFDFSGKLIESSDSECQSDSSKGDNVCTSNPQEPTSKQFPNSTSFLGKSFWELSALVNYHVVAILGYGDLLWRNILITRVYFVEGLGHNLFSVGQFYDSDLEVAFRRNTCFVKNLEGVDLLKGNRTTNLYTINLHKMAFASPICLLARATSTKSWLWHQHLSHLNFDTINDLAKMISSPVFQNSNIIKNIFVPHVSKEKSKKASHPPKYVPNLKQRLHLLHMDVCGPIRVEIINGKRYRLVIVDDYFRYTICNRRTKKIMEMMNVTFDELSAMAFKQRSSKPGLQSMTSGQISSGLGLTYAPSTITSQKPTERELNLLFEAMYNDYIGGQPSAAPRSAPPAPAIQNLHTPNASRTVKDSAPTPTNSSSQAVDIPNTS
ncbi:hypothetical protein Tco_1406423 [Tanacetum coccineum]